MTDLILRDYQKAAIDKLKLSLRSGKRRPVLMAPTGAGKTIIAAEIIRMARAKDSKVMFVVPALTLIDQTVFRFEGVGIDEIGVVQGIHERTDWRQPVQVCSVQTLMRREIPDADFAIVDECHINFNFYDKWFKRSDWKDRPIIGLSATPWARGMGNRWDDLITPTTLGQLIKLGHLSDFRVFAPGHPDLEGVKITAGDYNLKDLGERMADGALVADIVSTWIEKADRQPTVAFCVDRIHAKTLQQRFQEAGVNAEYMDAFTDREERHKIIRAFENGDVQVICNVGVLTTGFDSDVRCVILARPTKSEMLYVQMVGRGLRTAPGKKDCLILDHSDTTLRLGFVDDINHKTLHDGAARQNPAVKKERMPKECPKCAYLKPPKISVCPNCGHKPEPVDQVEQVTGFLMELDRNSKQTLKSKDWPLERKQAFYSDLLCHCGSRGWKDGWAAHAYKKRLGVWPEHRIEKEPARYVSMETQSWIQHYNIAKAYARKRKGAA